MKVALNTRSLTSDHKVRGIGFYTQRLLNQFQQLSKTKKNFQLFEFSQQPPVDVDIIHYPAFTLFSSKISFFNSIPTIITVHDLIPLKYPQHFPLGIKARIKWMKQKQSLKKAQAIITDSQVSQQDIIKFTKINADKIHVIYLAADKIFRQINNQQVLKNIKRLYKLPQKFILYVGDMNWNKNIPLLAQTCLDLNYSLVVVGKQAVSEDFDHQHPENKDLISFQNLAQENPQQIIRLGFIPTKDLSAIYNLATCYAQPSHAEGFGLTILEAMACACPVITSKNTSLAEIAEQSAVLIDSKNKKELTSALQNYWQNPSLRQKMSQLGLNQIKKYSWQKTAQQTLEVYEKILV